MSEVKEEWSAKTILFEEADCEPTVILVSLLTVTLNWVALGVPLVIPVSCVFPLNTWKVVPLPVITGFAPSASAGIACDSFVQITVNASSPSDPAAPGCTA